MTHLREERYGLLREVDWLVSWAAFCVSNALVYVGNDIKIWIDARIYESVSVGNVLDVSDGPLHVLGANLLNLLQFGGRASIIDSNASLRSIKVIFTTLWELSIVKSGSTGLLTIVQSVRNYISCNLTLSFPAWSENTQRLESSQRSDDILVALTNFRLFVFFRLRLVHVYLIDYFFL